MFTLRSGNKRDQGRTPQHHGQVREALCHQRAQPRARQLRLDDHEARVLHNLRDQDENY